MRHLLLCLQIVVPHQPIILNVVWNMSKKKLNIGAKHGKFRWHSKVSIWIFMLKNQFLILLNENNKDTSVVKKKVSMALDPATPQRSKLEAFIRRGGDQPDKTSCDRLYQDFIKSDEELDVKETYSIFNAMTEGNHVLQPIFRYQTENSVVCFLICAANAISYTMELRSQSNAQESFQQYSINIGRYMRNNLSDKDIYRCVFAERGGGYPLNILEELLTATRNGIVNPTNTVDASFVDDDDDDDDMLWDGSVP
mmetsp:Transcript_1654/g.1850  ORF Transcript_1654/g.1850 Transcript_1654/m.1850 type:complete len:253 (-) Transcript_1654:194-952(-)